MIKILSFSLALSLFFLPQSDACTAFRLKAGKDLLVGESYDWNFHFGHGAVFAQPRGIKRIGKTVRDAKNPAGWTSQYGNVTFTQFGRGLPISGMNEKGLVVVVLQLDETKYNEQQEDLQFVNEGQLEQYMLDNFANTKEVVEKVSALRVMKAFIGLHYFVTDASGDSAIVEFLDGAPVVRSGDDITVHALTNNTYPDLIENLAKEGTDGLPTKLGIHRTSQVRFRTAAKFLRQEGITDIYKVGREIFEGVRQFGTSPDSALSVSQWSVLFNPLNGKIEFRTRNAPTWKTLDAFKLIPAAGKPSKALDMNIKINGPADGQFQKYSNTFNKQLIEMNGILLSAEAKKRAYEIGDTGE